MHHAALLASVNYSCCSTEEYGNISVWRGASRFGAVAGEGQVTTTHSSICISADVQAYKALVASGIDFLDTAEVYGFGLSEEFGKSTGWR